MKTINTFLTLVIGLFLVTQIYSQSASRVEENMFYSFVLDLNKKYTIYLPEGYHTDTVRYPVVYFLRLRESEMFDPNAPGRKGKTLKDVADSLIENGLIGKMIIVCPSTGGTNGWSGLVNMLRPDLSLDEGIGTGQFEDYFFKDLIPLIEYRYRTIPDREHRAIDGFSWGGYTSLVYALRNPGKFCSVGSYDAPLMWYNLDDPDLSGNAPDDPMWIKSPIPIDNDFYDSVFDTPRNIDYMLEHNSTNIIVNASEEKIDSFKSMRFHIHTKLLDPRDIYGFNLLKRNIQFADSLAARGINNTFENIILSWEAEHDYAYADLHASKSLIKHWETFQQVTSTPELSVNAPSDFVLYQNYPNPFNPSTTIKFSIPVGVNSEESIVNLKIYDMLGEEVATLVNAHQRPGNYEVRWDASGQASGVYFYILTAGTFTETKKMVLLR